MRYYKSKVKKWLVRTEIKDYNLPMWVPITSEEFDMYLVSGHIPVDVHYVKEIDTAKGIYKDTVSITDARTGEVIL